MELQTALVNDRIDDLRKTAQEIHAGRTVVRPDAGSSLAGLRRGIGWRLIGLGLLLVSAGHGSDTSAARMA